MKVTSQNSTPQTKPLTVTLETEAEQIAFYALLNANSNACLDFVNRYKTNTFKTLVTKSFGLGDFEKYETELKKTNPHLFLR